MNYVVNREIKEKGGKLFFADLTATFNKVNREKLSRIMEKKGISKNTLRTLRTRIDKISKDTVAPRAKCPLNPTLLSLYTADLEKMRRRQTGRVVIERENI